MKKDRRKILSPEMLEAIGSGVGIAIREHVNGKIDNMSHKFDDYVVGDLKWKEVVDTKLKELEPVSTGLKTVGGLRRFIIYIGGFGIGGGLVYFIKELFK